MSFATIEGESDRLTCNVADIPTDDSNLVIKALKLYRSKTGTKHHFDVDLQKIVPHGAGLGGGSANAATTMWAANRICGSVSLVTDLASVQNLASFRLHQMQICWNGRRKSDQTFLSSFQTEQPIAQVHLSIVLWRLQAL